MAASKSTKKTADLEQEALHKVAPVANLVGRTAKEIWKIFVLRYVAKGVAEVFAASVITLITYNKLWTHHWVYFVCIPLPIALLLVFDAIQLLINPAYFAMGDVENAIKRNTSKTNEITVINR